MRENGAVSSLSITSQPLVQANPDSIACMQNFRLPTIIDLISQQFGAYDCDGKPACDNIIWKSSKGIMLIISRLFSQDLFILAEMFSLVSARPAGQLKRGIIVDIVI